jgi:hypothetical protein
MSHQVRTYTELRQQIHDDLRIQHPEWVQPNGESPMCDAYESRLTQLLDALTRTGSNESIAAKLNIANGADGSAVASAIASADAMIGSLVIPYDTLPTSQTNALVQTLTSYNEGRDWPRALHRRNPISSHSTCIVFGRCSLV